MDGEAPPPPKITSESVVTTDITEQFVAAAKSETLAFPSPNHSAPPPRSGFAGVETLLRLTDYAALEPGELVKDGFFTLFEAVGGLEVRHCHFCQGSAAGSCLKR